MKCPKCCKAIQDLHFYRGGDSARLNCGCVIRREDDEGFFVALEQKSNKQHERKKNRRIFAVQALG